MVNIDKMNSTYFLLRGIVGSGCIFTIALSASNIICEKADSGV